MLDRDTIKELNALSKEVFGTTSKWKKMVELGVMEPVMEDTKKLSEDGKKITEVVKTQKTDDNEIPLFYMHHYTILEIREFMLMVLDRRKQMEQAFKQIEAQRKAQSALDQASGTAVNP